MSWLSSTLSGVVQQEDNLDDELNVIQNLMIYARFYNMPGKAARDRIDYLLGFPRTLRKGPGEIKELSAA